MPGPYREAWEDFRRRRRRTIIVLAGWFVLLAGIGVLGRVSPSAQRRAAPVALAYAALMAAVGLHWSSWRCPRCGRRFALRQKGQPRAGGACIHCGLPRWAEDDPDRPAAPARPYRVR